MRVQSKPPLKGKANAFQDDALRYKITPCCHWIPPPRRGTICPLPFRMSLQSNYVQSPPMSHDSLTHVQLLLTWNPSQLRLQQSHLNTCYSHQDRHAGTLRTYLRNVFSRHQAHHPTHYMHTIETMNCHQPHGTAPSIFGANPFDR